MTMIGGDIVNGSLSVTVFDYRETDGQVWIALCQSGYLCLNTDQA